MKDQVHSGHHHHPNDHISPPQVHINQSSPGHYHPTVQQDEKILIWFNIEWSSPTLQWEDVRGHRARSKSCFYAPDCGMSLPSLLQHLVPSSFLFHALNPFQVVPASNPMQKITWHFWESGYFKRLVAVYNALVQQALIPMMRRVWIQNRNFKSFSKVCGYTFYIHTLIKCMVKGYKMESLASWAVTNQKMQSYNNWKKSSLLLLALPDFHCLCVTQSVTQEFLLWDFCQTVPAGAKFSADTLVFAMGCFSPLSQLAHVLHHRHCFQGLFSLADRAVFRDLLLRAASPREFVHLVQITETFHDALSGEPGLRIMVPAFHNDLTYLLHKLQKTRGRVSMNTPNPSLKYPSFYRNPTCMYCRY